MHLKENGQNRLRNNKNKKFVYLISPIKIKSEIFFSDLDKIFKTKKVYFFQLRLKKESRKKKYLIGKRIKKICKLNKVKFIVNDDPVLAKDLGADGCHLGQKDMSITNSRKILKNKIIGITCHNSKKLILGALSSKPNYIAIGSFFASKTKKVKYKAKIDLLKYAKSITNTPIVAIGGINLKNYKKLLLNKANFLAISGYIWNNKKYKPIDAIRKLK